MFFPRRSLKCGTRDGGVYDKHRDGSAEYYAPSGSVKHYSPPYYSDEDRSDDGYYSSESPEETDSEPDDYKERGPGRGYYVPDNRVAALAQDSESPSEGDVPDSESETETDDYSDRYAPEGYESGSAYDRDDYDSYSYGGSYDDWDDYDDDGYGEYDGIFMLLLTCIPSSVYSFLPRRRRRRLRLLLLDQMTKILDDRFRITLVVHKVLSREPNAMYIHLLCYYQSVLAVLHERVSGKSDI